jgi:methylmalonyl-CoA mutase N-terminal domain/subunit
LSNAYDEAITTPTPESVRRAVAIPMIDIVGSSTRNWA